MDIISHLFVYWIEFPQSATKLLKSRDNSLNVGVLLRLFILLVSSKCVFCRLFA